MHWPRLSRNDLLDERLCDLGLTIEGTELEHRVDQLYANLEDKGLSLRPHIWLSSEWFSPDGIPGVAIPFYLAHPRLKRLEKAMMLDVEGGSKRDCMKLLRHETGHAYSTAYRLHYKRSFRETFGSITQPYPDSYVPRPFSREYVQSLDWWYAQSHPAEDFAETFSVWLDPYSRWRRRYRNWGAIRKLELVDELMADIAGKTPPVRSRKQVDPLRRIRTTLRDHYEWKRDRYAAGNPRFFDRDLRRLFSDDADHRSRPPASSFLRSNRVEIRERVALWTGADIYTIDLVIRDMIERCQQLGLRVHSPRRDANVDAMLMVSVQTMHNLHRGQYRITV